MCRFVIKTKEQRALEKAEMLNSPLATLTLEDFLESERHKLTGTLTHVTPESFAKWKQGRLDKKAAEKQAMEAKEATGRAMFEAGGWKGTGSDDDSDDDDDNNDVWNLEAMRKETERLRQKKEEERLAKENGMTVEEVREMNGTADEYTPVQNGADGDADGEEGSGGQG
jgi:hypothetical protein